MDKFWNIYVILLVASNLLIYAILSHWFRKKTLKHDFNRLNKCNNPQISRWFILFFYILVFNIIYLTIYIIFYNDIETYKLTFTKKYQKEISETQKNYDPIITNYFTHSIKALSKISKALKVGQYLFNNNCAACHNSDAKGKVGFSNLSDNSWIYGGNPNSIRQTITNGRVGIMPAMSNILGGEQAIKQVASYVVQIRTTKNNINLASGGEPKFKTICVACHSASTQCNLALNSPNLTHGNFMYGTTQYDIEETLRNGRKSIMPAHKTLLTVEHIHLLTAFIYSINQYQE